MGELIFRVSSIFMSSPGKLEAEAGVLTTSRPWVSAEDLQLQHRQGEIHGATACWASPIIWRPRDQTGELKSSKLDAGLGMAPVLAVASQP